MNTHRLEVFRSPKLLMLYRIKSTTLTIQGMQNRKFLGNKDNFKFHAYHCLIG